MRNRSSAIRVGLAGAAFVAASTLGLQAASASGNPCGADASAPEFDGNLISGEYGAICGSNPKADIMVGKIKEDRSGLPDPTHDTESFAYIGTESDFIATVTCQDGDDIYIEANNDDDNEQSGRRNMSC